MPPASESSTIPAMISLQNIALRRGDKELFSQLELNGYRGDRIGVTGKNGCGKSSLFAMILGELEPDEGEFSIQPGTEIAQVRQETPHVQTSAIDYALQGDSELTTLNEQLIHATANDDHQAMADIHTRLEDIDAWSAPSRAARLLTGLGFSQEQHTRPVTDFSGGWRMRLNLAQALMCRSDLLLLDEPTNHLDLDAVIWLGEWLRSYPGLLLLISHDRDFLDEVCTAIAHIEHGTAKRYSGNYSDFERQRAEQLAQQAAAHEKQQREIAHMEDFVRRFRAKATKAKQAQSRLKRLESLTRIAPAHVDSPYHFEFTAGESVPQHILRMDGVSLGYDGTALLTQLRFTLEKGDRLGLLGRNGAGKSTLIKAIAGTLEPLDGEVWTSSKCRIGYFAQHQLEQVDADDTPLALFQRDNPDVREQELRNFLGSFNFDNDRCDQKTGQFSGGEKARLVLARLVYQKPQLLLLDEPTNHLDLEMRHALNLALQSYEGAVVLVSHDRYLLSSVCDQLLLIDQGNAREFTGSLEDYADWSRQQLQQEATKSRNEPTAVKTDNKKEQRQARAVRRKQLQPMRQTVSKLEKSLEKSEQALAEVENHLADSSVYEEKNKDTLLQLLKSQATLKDEKETLEMEWMEASETLEQAEKTLDEGSHD
ncbi:MAG: ATP-binding cassette domain-containing protein [bacterium]